MKSRAYIASFLASCLFSFSVSAEETAKLTIEITQGIEQPVKIAVVPFDTEVGIDLPENLYQIVLRNIQISGQLAPLKARDMPSLPIEESQVVYDEWQDIEVEYLMMAKLVADTGPGKRYKISYMLFDIFGNRKIRDEELYFTDRSVRDTAHFLSDLVYEEITGVKGIFSTKIAYVSITGKRIDNPLFRLEIADIDGKRAQVLLSSRQPIFSPTWSPDGTHMAYVSFERNKSNIYTQNLRTGERKLISDFKGVNSAPSWSPDGSKIALVLSRRENVDVYVMNLFSGKFNRITSTPGIDTEPSWSADGKSLVYVSERAGRAQIFEVDFAKKVSRQVTTEGRYNTRPRYVENGRGVVFVKQSKGYRLVKKNLISGEEIFLSKTTSDESPSVAPNGNMIIYSTKVRGKSVLVVVSSDGQVEYKLPSVASEVIDPVWSNYRI